MDEMEWIHGRKAVLDYLRTSADLVDQVYVQKDLAHGGLQRVLDACKKAGVRYSLAPHQRLDQMVEGNHQGCVAKLFSPGFAPLESLLELARQSSFPLLLALDQVQDQGNLGTLARTLYAMGGAGILLPKHNSAQLGPGAMKASAGALSFLPVSKVANLGQALEQAREAGFTVYGTRQGDDAESIYSLRPEFPVILVLGNEDKGVRPGVLNHCDHQVRIPMAGAVDSMNVAQAGAVILGLFYGGVQAG